MIMPKKAKSLLDSVDSSELDSSFYFTWSQATRAYSDSLRRTVNDSLNSSEVWRPCSSRVVHSVRYIVTRHFAFTANFTSLSHLSCTSFERLNNISIYIIPE